MPINLKFKINFVVVSGESLSEFTQSLRHKQALEEPQNLKISNGKILHNSYAEILRNSNQISNSKAHLNKNISFHFLSFLSQILQTNLTFKKRKDYATKKI